jgi:hypothetical protein
MTTSDDADDHGARLRGLPGARRSRSSACLFVCVGVGLAFGVASLAAASPPSAPSFAKPTLYAAGKGPQSVAIGDLNGDGKQDIVTANYNGDSVSVLLGRGGGFRTKSDYRTGEFPASIALGDFNGDGRPDVVVTSLFLRPDSTTVSVLLNRGDGRLLSPASYRVGRQPYEVVTADLNLDGNLDAVTANHAGDTVSVLFGSGDGTLQSAITYATAVLPESVAVGDLTGDRKPDIAIATGVDSGLVSVLINRGDGTFARRVDYRTGVGPHSIAIEDLNGDSKPDVVTVNDDSLGTHTLSVLLNRGDGTFVRRADDRLDCACHSLAIGDLNGDRRPDIATDGQYDCISGRTSPFGRNSPFACLVVLASRGRGRFQPFRYVDTFNDHGDTPRSLAIGDVNGDGRADLVTVGNRVSVLLASTKLPCVVPDLRGQNLAPAKRVLTQAHCRVGRIEWTSNNRVPKGRVVKSDPAPPTVMPGGSTVSLLVSNGSKR